MKLVKISSYGGGVNLSVEAVAGKADASAAFRLLQDKDGGFHFLNHVAAIVMAAAGFLFLHRILDGLLAVVVAAGCAGVISARHREACREERELSSRRTLIPFPLNCHKGLPGKQEVKQ